MNFEERVKRLDEIVEKKEAGKVVGLVFKKLEASIHPGMSTLDIDEIVEKISSKALPLEESLKLYEEGNEIIRELEKALKEAQEKVEKIVDIEDK